ncbi:MAG: excinuclease ABC subunit UvrC [Erysipelotrichaceae bacterium]|nr:excinuclease ABC subunit UvrC [Erysipelotrichaceae bacterium]
MKENLKDKLATLPMEPGCYIMKDKNEKIIYVGKAKKLKNRVNQYFVGAHDFKTTKMVSLINDFEYIICDNEKEALILEFNLIKKHRPRYNIMFIDDKSYPYIKLSSDKYPMLSVVRDIKKNRNSKYFGPYPDAGAAYNTLKILRDLYPLRRCKTIPKKVCLYYHLGQCLGPCEFQIDESIFDEMVLKITKFLKGDVKDTIDELYKKMYEASDRLDFEKAKEYADSIKSINHVVDNIQVQKEDNIDRDVFAYFNDKGYISIQGFLVRSGKVIEREFKLNALYGEAEEEFVSFIIQYYENHLLPKELILPLNIDCNLISEVLDTKIIQPKNKGYRKNLIEMCINNAKNQLENKFEVAKRKSDEIELANNKLSDILGREISRVEIFDNSHTSGTFTVSAMVVYEDGLPLKKDYRIYKLHTQNSDVDSMKEVIYRRYFRVLNDNLKKCDLIIVDGGYNQIKAAKEIVDSLELDILVVGLVKDKNHSTNSLMDFHGEIYDINKNSPLFFLLTRMQDEVHRVAINYHRKLRSKAQTKSILDEIEGVGEVRKKELLKHFKSFKGIKEASIDELSQIVPLNVAKTIYSVIHDGVL